MADPAPPTPPADDAIGDGSPGVALAPQTPAPPAETLDMRQVAGERPAVPQPAKPGKKNETSMTAVGPTDGALSTADQNLVDLGTKRGIETLFRTSYRTNMDLTSLADAKANIMISINGLMVSILIASIAPKVDANTWLYYPTSLILIGCLGSLVYAVLAARPRVQSTVVTVESALQNRTNLLFFGNFHHMTQAEYVFAMKQVVQDPTQIYEMMMKDVYGIGSVLQKKYELLRKSYTIFIAALVVGVVAFIATFWYAAAYESGPNGTVVTYEAPVPVAPADGTPLPPGAQPGTGGIFP
ncbi:Pycsar system effector family protein [Rubrivirga litoralis]|uniref:DUF5706 domain-containing protein n=1 Tax=Rubrivirga litoralis TaxID=3075598 RepID=A0ABU3BPS1_9BACT|nr:Pycsar system effector family protein [Rubrivirga sp. F394]MDT0631282.1 DUF5706 domain-containing protein [Rubrivirga sp. F394]